MHGPTGHDLSTKGQDRSVWPPAALHALRFLLLAIGYEGPERKALLDPLGVPLDDRGRVATENDYTTPKAGVFSAGDATRGASLVVWAIADGRGI